MFSTTSAVVLWLVFVYILGMVLVTSILFGIRKRSKSILEYEMSIIETEKNKLISPDILSELSKVKSLVQNTKFEYKYKDWDKQFSKIQSDEMSKLTDLIISIETLIENNNFDEANYNITLAEITVLKIKVHINNLIKEIQEITQSEEKNRSAVTRIRTIYREASNKYNSNKDEYNELSKTIDLQFDNINRLFSAFEKCMENNEYEETSKIVKALDDTVNNINVIINEAPNVILLCEKVVPKKINDVRVVYNKMVKDGYNLSYLNLDYNIEEAEKKINDILDKLKVLNLEDSIFELKTMVDYFESLFGEFEKEKVAKKYYDEEIDVIRDKITRVSLVIKSVFNEIDELKDTYDLHKEDLGVLEDLNKEIVKIKDDYKLASDRTQLKNFPYSKLCKEFELTNVKISKLEDKLNSVYKSLGNLKEDEVRAREQIDEIKAILKDTKYNLNSSNMPVKLSSFDVQYDEAVEAIREINIELEKRPISIETLNTRVDTARDLALKVFNNVNEACKNSELTELSMIYGNRYRSENKEVEIGLIRAEKEFFKGEYKKSLETILNALNIVEPGIHKRILESYNEQS